jgi:hypothetical protein
MDQSDFDILREAGETIQKHQLVIPTEFGAWHVDLSCMNDRLNLLFVPNNGELESFSAKSFTQLTDLAKGLYSAITPKSDEQRAMEQVEDALHKRTEEGK